MTSATFPPETRSATLAEQLRNALRKAPASVALVTAGSGADALGMTATAVTSVSLDPPAMLACVNKALRLNAAIRAHASFRITYLRRDQEEIARVFGSGVMDCAERFRHGDWNLDAPHGPELVGALASLSCRLDSATDCGTHSVFIGHVEAVRTGVGTPLLYCDGFYAGLTLRS